MVYSIWYRRPRHVEEIPIPEEIASKSSSIASGISGPSFGIPDALSFDKIIAGGTCPPCTTRDFMNYLVYIEHSAENLQFFLWAKDYKKRFNELPASEAALARAWSAADLEIEAKSQGLLNTVDGPAAAILFKGTDFAAKPKVTVSEANPFHDPSHTPTETGSINTTHYEPSIKSSNGSTMLTGQVSLAQKTAGAFESADLKWQPLTVQPFREEIARIIATYLAEGASRELNISSRERTAVLHALQNTTHPSALQSVLNTVEWSLRCQAHPNFIRWTICNGNRPRVIFARGLGVSVIVFGFAAAVVLTLSNAGRGWRALAAIGWVMGVATLVAAWKGMCVVLHGMHHRHLRPWELFEDDSSVDSFQLGKTSFDSFGSTNSYEDEPWVVQYDKRNIVRKVFDREVWIQEPALRQIQDTIFLQAVGGSIVIAAIFAAIFVCLPKGKLF
ncbi:MAG: hypothetical protein M1814_006271 [Vezdaea aestivalis]|nr:MAG: hypothetical protein M1814_006271 [Vezdaea aestivalis]